MAIDEDSDRRRPREKRITYAVCFGFNNAMPDVSLALLHFPAETILLVNSLGHFASDV